MNGKGTNRILYIDWMRGLASILMLQGHCFDSWLSPSTRESTVFGWSQIADTLPAPLFLFLAGFSFAVITDKLRQKGNSASAVARRTMLRGGQVFLIGILFRLQEYLFGRPWAPWTDLLRVDVLNIIGISLIAMGLACRIAASNGERDPQAVRRASIVAALVAGIAVATITPHVWTSWRPHWLPWWLESYFNGVHNFDTPQSWLFPFFPWSAFAFAGLAVGFFFTSDWARKNETRAAHLAGVGGVALIALGLLLDAQPLQLYSNYDFWHTSPNFVLIRVGIVLVILKASHFWSRLWLARWGFSPLLELGRCSLLIYWVHAELIYGRYSILPKGAVDVATAVVGLLTIYACMITLAAVRNRIPYKRGEVVALFRRLARNEANA